MLLMYEFLFFFFKQKTAYEMRISDWSSDVCSSDLAAEIARHADQPHRRAPRMGPDPLRLERCDAAVRDRPGKDHRDHQRLPPEQAFEDMHARCGDQLPQHEHQDRKSTRLNSSH